MQWWFKYLLPSKVSFDSEPLTTVTLHHFQPSPCQTWFTNSSDSLNPRGSILEIALPFSFDFSLIFSTIIHLFSCFFFLENTEIISGLCVKRIFILQQGNLLELFHAPPTLFSTVNSPRPQLLAYIYLYPVYFNQRTTLLCLFQWTNTRYEDKSLKGISLLISVNMLYF